MQLARSAIAEAFSNKVITPGVTTTSDVYWFLRERYRELGLPVWFQPYCNVQRRDPDNDGESPFIGDPETVIQRGDILHTDVGIRYLRLSTDTQEMGYVLRPNERDVPDGLKRALARGNHWQDLLTSSFVAGRTGNEILAATLEKCASEGIRGSIYTHPLGHHGHGAGPTIGMWDNQGPTPVRGDWRLHKEHLLRDRRQHQGAAARVGRPVGADQTRAGRLGSTARRSPTSAAARRAGTSCAESRLRERAHGSDRVGLGPRSCPRGSRAPGRSAARAPPG